MYNLYFENSRGVRRLVRMMVAEDKLCSTACEETAKINPEEDFVLKTQIVNQLEGFSVCLVQHSFAIEKIEKQV